MTRTVVTGAAGFIGSHLSERLLALGHEVIGIDCFTDFYEKDRKLRNLASLAGQERFRLVEDDLLVLDLAEALAGAECIFHLAAQAGVRPSWGKTFEVYVRNNITATQRLLEAAKDVGVPKLIYASSSSVYGDAPDLPVTEESSTCPVSPYGVTKLAAEHLCGLYARLHGLSVISLRLFTVYGPRQRPDMAIQRFLSACLADGPITVYGDGSQTRDFTFVEDVVEAHICALDASPEETVFNVCGGSRISVNDLLALVRDVTGRPPRLEHAATAPGDARDTWGDNSLARRVLGFHPRVDLAQGLATQWEWIKGGGSSGQG